MTGFAFNTRRDMFKDVRVREALYRSIDIEAIKKSVMRGMSLPTGAMISPQVHGYSDELGKRVPYDVERPRHC